MLLRGGLRDADVLLAEFDAVGDGVEDILISLSVFSCFVFVSDMLSFEVVDMMVSFHANCPVDSPKILGYRLLFCDKLSLCLS